MIYLYSGTPGSGKSCHQAENIITSLKVGSCVVANYDINLEKLGNIRGQFYCMENDILTPGKLIDLSRWWFSSHKFREGGIKLYIDEAQLLFNSRDWEDTRRMEWLKFFTQHRKLGYDVFLIAQNDRMLDRQIRTVIEYNVLHRRMSNYGIGGKILNIIFGGGTYMCITIWYPIRQRISSEMHHIRKKYYSIYDSYKSFEEVEKEDNVNHFQRYLDVYNEEKSSELAS